MSPGYAASVAALEALEGQGMKLGLERTVALLDRLGRPQEGLRGVLVAGTNGKGSVCALVDSMARAAGLRTVLLTKPHLVSWRERIVLDGAPLAEEMFAALLDECMAAAADVEARHGQPTVFEVITAAGVLAAARSDPDVVVCEVGLGGRLDSTNVLDLGVAVVTNIALDHRQQLGSDLRGIAAEKAAIIKADNDVVTGAAEPALAVIRAAAAAAGARSLVELTAGGPGRGSLGTEGSFATVDGLRLTTPLLGAFQADNLAIAATAARAISGRGAVIGDEAMRRGAAAVRWPARMQWFAGEPAMLVDGCHNPAAVAAMAAAANAVCAGRRTVIVFGAMADKELDAMLAALRGLPGEVIFTAPSAARAAHPEDLLQRWQRDGGAAVAMPTMDAAITRARTSAGTAGVVVVCGSLYVAGEALAWLAATGVATGLIPAGAS